MLCEILAGSKFMANMPARVLLHVLSFCVEQYFFLMLLDGCIARKGTWLLHVLPWFFVSHRRSAWIKKLILRKWLQMANNLGLDPFPDHVGHFGAPWRPFWILQAVWRCRRWACAPGAARLVFYKQLFYKKVSLIIAPQKSETNFWGTNENSL